MNGVSPLQVRVTGIVFQPSWIEIRTTTSSISRVQRVEISDAVACSTRRGPDSMEATWTPETSSPHSATNRPRQKLCHRAGTLSCRYARSLLSKQLFSQRLVREFLLLECARHCRSGCSGQAGHEIRKGSPGRPLPRMPGSVVRYTLNRNRCAF